VDEYQINILNKIDAGEKLTKGELREFRWTGKEISTEYGENRRWSRSATSIVQIGERYFCLEWEEGLTECQENEYYEEPYEVEKKTYEKTITVTEWVAKSK